MKTRSSGGRAEPKVFSTLKSDFRSPGIVDSIRREIVDTRDFLLDEERRKRVAGMNPVKGWLVSAWWMLKGMFFRLTPGRRIIFVVGVLLLIITSNTWLVNAQGLQVSFNSNYVGVLCIVLVLMLELKDKVLAKEELEAGRVVQDALQPERSPDLPGWDLWLFTRSANDVGGDLVDFIRFTETRAGLVLGDVAGKGLRAALLMAKLQATVRAIAEDAPSLSSLASTVNRIFYRDSLRNIFASMIYLEIAPGSGRIRMVNAGHFPPMIARGGEVESMPKGGAALGLTAPSEYAEQMTELADGDIFCAYSDGVSEAQNAAGEFFGEHRIREILRRNRGGTAGRTGTELVTAVDAFIGEAKRRDDLTLLIIGRGRSGTV